MPRNRSSVIWIPTKEQFAKIVAESATYTQLLQRFHIISKGGNNNTVRRRCIEEGIDYSHLKSGYASNKGKKFPHKGLSREECFEKVFVNDSAVSRNCVKRYIKKFTLLEYRCKCGNEGKWQDKPLSLQIDHINGESQDHRLENLRWICPNCHSQTETFTGKHKKTKQREYRKKMVERELANPEWKKVPRPSSRKVERPTNEDLSRMVWEETVLTISRRFGVTDNAVRKWCQSMKIDLPPCGYWIRRKNGWTHEDALNPPVIIKGSPSITALTQAQVQDVRDRYLGGESQRELAKAFKVSRNAIHEVINNPRYGFKYGKDNLIAI